MKFINWHSLFILFCLLLSAKANAQRLNPLKEINKILNEHQVQGAAVALLKKDTVLWNGYFGKANLDEDKPVTKSTLFGLGSISKTFLALGAMIAQEKNQLDINRPLRQMDSTFSFTNEFEASNPLKLVHLLEHTSGFDEAHFDIFAKANSKTLFETIIGESQSALTTRWPPGHYYTYNTLNYIAAASVLERQVNTVFENYIRQEVFQPLKMNNATYFPTEDPDLARAYSGSSIEPFPDIPQWTAGSLCATLEEMQRFTQLFLNEGSYENSQLLLPETIKEMETPTSSLLARNGVDYGYGKGLMQEFIGQNVFYGHNGSYGGFLSEFGYSYNADVGYVILINNRNGASAIKAIKQLLLEPYTTVANNEKMIVQNITGELSEIEGAYQPVTANLEILYPFMRLADLQFVEREGDNWVQKSILGDAQELVRVGEYHFKLKNQPKSTNAFMVDDTETLWLSETNYRKISRLSARFQFYAAVVCIAIATFSFMSILFSIIRRLIQKRKIVRIQWVAFAPVCFLILMGISVTFFYDPMQLYSVGAVLFYISGWLFIVLSFFTLLYLLKNILRKKKVKKWLLIQTSMCTSACVIISSYLFYWEIIGLKLWNY